MKFYFKHKNLKEQFILDERLILTEDKDKSDDYYTLDYTGFFDDDQNTATSGKFDIYKLRMATENGDTTEQSKQWKLFFKEHKGLDKFRPVIDQEIIELGDNENKNYFLKFINNNNWILKAADWQKYAEAIHNPIVRHLLTPEDLEGKGSFKLENIIFCQDLYKHQPHEIKRYIELQALCIENNTAIGKFRKWFYQPTKALFIKDWKLNTISNISKLLDSKDIDTTADVGKKVKSNQSSVDDIKTKLGGSKDTIKIFAAWLIQQSDLIENSDPGEISSTIEKYGLQNIKTDDFAKNIGTFKQIAKDNNLTAGNITNIFSKLGLKEVNATNNQKQ